MGTPAGAVDFCKYTKTLDLKPVILMPGIPPPPPTHTPTHTAKLADRGATCAHSVTPPRPRFFPPPSSGAGWMVMFLFFIFCLF